MAWRGIHCGESGMMARRGVLGVLAGAGAFALSGCGMFGGNRYRFKMTVEVETPQGLKTASGVYSVLAFKTSELITGGTSSDTEFKGEAVAVDLPRGKTLFALLRMANGTSSDDNIGIMSMRTLDPRMINTEKDKSVRRIVSGDGIKSPAEVAPEDYPLLVTFGNTNDPTSVKRVDPADLVGSFGPGVRLKRIVVEKTDEPVTTGIRKKLTAMGIENGRGLDRTGGVTASPTLAQQLGYTDFVKGSE
jgi:hypothetical protein